VVGRIRFALERWDSPRHRSHVAQLFSLGIMRASPEKIKKADKHLFIAVMFCVVVGLMLSAFTLRTYLKRQLQADMDWNKAVPVAVYEPLLNTLRVFVFLILPAMATSLFGVAYLIWDYRHKRGAINDHDKSDA